jgi:sarcosine oxidase
VPAVIERSLHQPGWYAYVVPGEVPGGDVKIGQFWREQAPLDPDSRTLDVDEAVIELHSRYAQRRLPTLSPVPSHSESCLYDMTASEDAIIDRIGQVAIGTGFSGHGFKFMPAVGGLVADLAIGTTPSVLPSRFGLAAHAASVVLT